MGCLKKFAKMILFFTLLFCFFAYGGYAYVKAKYDAYTHPEREVFIKEVRDFGDLTGVSADYSLSRSLNFFGYRKINAFYLPDKQSISVFDLNSNEVLTLDDFNSGKIEQRLEEFSSNLSNLAIVPISDVEIIKKGKLKTANGVSIPYADFKAHMKFAPIVGVKGTIALYTTQNKEGAIEKIKSKIRKNNGVTSKLILSTKLWGGYKEKPFKKFISQIRL